MISLKERMQTDEKGIIYLETIKLVKKVGKGGHVMLPKELIGKEVKVIYRRKNE